MGDLSSSSRPDSIASYAIRELVADMVELHDALGGVQVVWPHRAAAASQ
ncbi:hypothetical protein [Paraburkholderia heleia]